MLSVLQTSTSLHTLQLLHVEVKPSHQLSILSIPTLKALVLNFSYFFPTATKMPVSSITSLSLGPVNPPAAIKHTLRLFRSTLEILEISFIPVDVPLILEAVQLPRLTCFTLYSVTPEGLTEFTPRASSTITKLCIITSCEPCRFGLSDGVFPKLREVSSPWWIGVQLVPGRPVQVFYDTEFGEMELSNLQADLVLLAQSTRGIKVLRLSTSLSMHCLLQYLATHVTQLQRLYLWMNTQSLMTIPLESQQPPIEGNLNALIEIHITFTDRIEWCDARPLTCHRLSAMCLWICPALELVTVSISDSISQQMFKLRRMRTGEWEDLV